MSWTRLILITYCALFLSILLYVPWKVEVKSSILTVKRTSGYAFLWNPPHRLARIDKEKILLELVIVTALLSAALVAVRRMKLS